MLYIKLSCHIDNIVINGPPVSLRFKRVFKESLCVLQNCLYVIDIALYVLS